MSEPAKEPIEARLEAIEQAVREIRQHQQWAESESRRERNDARAECLEHARLKEAVE